MTFPQLANNQSAKELKYSEALWLKIKGWRAGVDRKNVIVYSETKPPGQIQTSTGLAAFICLYGRNATLGDTCRTLALRTTNKEGKRGLQEWQGKKGILLSKTRATAWSFAKEPLGQNRPHDWVAERERRSESCRFADFLPQRQSEKDFLADRGSKRFLFHIIVIHLCHFVAISYHFRAFLIHLCAGKSYFPPSRARAT